MKILIAEDDNSLRHALKVLLQKSNYSVDAVDNGKDALDYMMLGTYDMVILDIMMPRMNGLEVVQKIRKAGNHVPVLLLTAKGEVEDKVLGLDLGANDYLSKPFDVRELLARVRVLTRKNEVQNNAVITYGNVSLDTGSFVISAPNGSFILSNKEYQVMLLLMHNTGRVLSAVTMMEKIWDAEAEAMENTLWTIIYNLRNKLRSAGADVEIKNHRHQGYVLEIKA